MGCPSPPFPQADAVCRGSRSTPHARRKEGPWQVCIAPSAPCRPLLLLLEELLVEEEDEQVDVDFGFVKHLHDGYALVLQLQQVLQEGRPSPWAPRVGENGAGGGVPTARLPRPWGRTPPQPPAPHLVVQLEPLHVDPHELGFHLEPPGLLAGHDVEDDVPEPGGKGGTRCPGGASRL